MCPHNVNTAFNTQKRNLLCKMCNLFISAPCQTWRLPTNDVWEELTHAILGLAHKMSLRPPMWFLFSVADWLDVEDHATLGDKIFNVDIFKNRG